MSNVVPINPKVPAIFANNVVDANDLVEGAGGAFAVLSIRGSRFRVKEGGDETVVTNDNGDPVASLDVVLVKANNALSKIFYKADYNEGDDAEPDCMSMDGVKPDPGVSNPQSKSCAACPNNVWGSKITPQGNKTKACSDNRRVALVPANHMEIDPYLLRVPAASLSPLADYGKKLAAGGIPYCALVTKVSFDTDVSYPKLNFKHVRLLDETEAKVIADHLHGSVVERILNTSVEHGTGESYGATANTEPEAGSIEELAQQAQTSAAVATVAAAESAPEPEPAPSSPDSAPVEPPEAAASDSELDDLLGSI